MIKNICFKNNFYSYSLNPSINNQEQNDNQDVESNVNNVTSNTPMVGFSNISR